MGLFTRKNKQKKEKELILTQEVPFLVEEAYKSLRTNVGFSLLQEKNKIVEITSAGQNEGKSVTAINLAISLARNGAKVALVDCDLRLPTVAQKLDIPQEPGLTQLLFDADCRQEVICHHSSGVDVIPAGSLPPNPSEILGSPRMTETLEWLKEQYEYVILDAPPVSVVTDAAVLAPEVSGIVLVVRQGQTREEGIDAAIAQLNMANGNILGFVLTDAGAEQKTYGHYGYSRYQKQ